MKCGISGRIRMLLLEIELDQIRPCRKYWRPLETISGSFSISFGSKLRVQSQCVPFLLFSRRGTIDE